MIEPINSYQPTFTGYQHPLKTLFKKGQMPSVKYGLYGGKLDIDNVSLEHLKPHSKGGKTVWGNLALAERSRNTSRGNNPLAEFLSWEMLESYLAQFNFRIKHVFDGYKYQDQVRSTCRQLGVGHPETITEAYGETFKPEKKLPKKILRSIRNKAKKADKDPLQLEMQFPLKTSKLDLNA